MTNREQRRLQQSLERRQAKQDQAAKTGRAAAPTRRQPTASDKNIFQRLIQFLREVRQELRRVSWPTRAQMVAFTTVVMITTTAITGYIYLLDQAFRTAVLGILGAN